ncbi:MAG: OmpA family protein [Planctomycetota bacterium]
MDRSGKTRRGVRLAAALCGCAFLWMPTGCQLLPKNEVERSREVTKDLRLQLDAAESRVAKIEQENGKLRQEAEVAQRQAEGQQDVVGILEKRVANLRRENDLLHEEMTGVVMKASAERPASPIRTSVASAGYIHFELPGDLERQLQAFAKRYQGAAFDPVDKVIRMQSDYVFRDGGDRLRSDAQGAMRELAQIFNSRAANRLNFLVVGHTAQGSSLDRDLLIQHPTDWHLAAHQAIAIEQYLEESGVSPTRMGIISYSNQQPLVDGRDDVAKRKNARVEIFVLPPDPPAELPPPNRPVNSTPSSDTPRVEPLQPPRAATN